MLYLPRDDQPGGDQYQDEPVGGPCAHLAEFGAVTATAVAAGIHGDGEGIGAGEAADKDRDEQASDAARPRDSAALVERDAAGGLSPGEALHLLDKDRDELYRDHGYKHQLVDRHPETLQRAEDELQA